MSDRNEYDPFAAPQSPQTPSDPSAVAPPPFAPPPSSQPGVDGVPPAPTAPYGYGAQAPYGYGQGAPYDPAAPYGAAPAYGATALYGEASAGSSQKNYLGILALIFPFVFLSVVGIIVGHMGLAAVKRGTANNRGVALAGTIVSWVFTVLVVPGLLAAIAIPIYLNQQDKANDAAVTSDLMNLNIAVTTHFVDQAEPPHVALEGDHYVVGDQTTPASASVEDVALVMLDGASYCLAVTYDGGQQLSLHETGAVVEGGCPDAVPQPTASEGEAPASDLAAFSDLVVGDCIADPADNIVQDASGASWITGVVIVDCAQSHYGEVYATGDMTGDTYVEADIYVQADDLCFGAYEAFMGVAYADSTFYYEPYYPSPDGWKYGDRETTCVVTSLASDTVGTLQGSGR